MAVSGVFGFLIPIFAFLLVFIIVYALLMKTKILGENQAVSLFISFILASFFVIETSLVEFVRLSSAWAAVVIVGILFVLLIIMFIPGGESAEMLTKGNWFSWIAIIIILLIFVGVSSRVFGWAINSEAISSWATTDWFGFLVLIVLALLVGWRLKA